MTRADNTRYLTQATAERHQETLRKASDAIAHLDSSGQPVNFSAVAAAAGVSRASLYRDPGIRDLISRIRAAPARSPATRAAAQRATAESLRTRLNTARAEITRLRAENTRWSTPGLVETRFSPDALVWVAVVFHGTAAWRNHGLIIFRFCFIEHLSSCAVQLSRLMAGCARRAAPWGAGHLLVGHPFCAAGSPGWSRVTLQRHRLRRRRRP
jgi:hypothetical protein